MDDVIRDQKVTGVNSASRNARLNGYLGRIQDRKILLCVALDVSFNVCIICCTSGLTPWRWRSPDHKVYWMIKKSQRNYTRFRIIRW
jgi:hypothetical protein